MGGVNVSFAFYYVEKLKWVCLTQGSISNIKMRWGVEIYVGREDKVRDEFHDLYALAYTNLLDRGGSLDSSTLLSIFEKGY